MNGTSSEAVAGASAIRPGVSAAASRITSLLAPFDSSNLIADLPPCVSVSSTLGGEARPRYPAGRHLRGRQPSHCIGRHHAPGLEAAQSPKATDGCDARGRERSGMTPEPTVQDDATNSDDSPADGIQGDDADQQQCEHHQGCAALTVAVSSCERDLGRTE